MPEYVYKAVTQNGIIVKNRVEENSKEALIKKLKDNGLMPINITESGVLSKIGIQSKTKKVRKNISNFDDVLKSDSMTNLSNKSTSPTKNVINKLNTSLAKTEKITTREILIFTENFYILKKANFNNIHALSTIIQSTENITFKGILEDILAGVEAGDYIYTTMEYYSDIFPYIYINIIKVGELSGSLTNSLEQAIKYLSDANDLSKKVRKLILPNIIQFVLIFIMLILGTLAVVPTIEGLYQTAGSTDKLPGITLWFYGVIKGFLSSWYIPTILIIIAIIALIRYIKTEKGRYKFDRFKYKMPIFGKLIYSLDFDRFIKAMLLNLENGLRIQEALEVSRNVVKNTVFLSLIETSINNIIVGQSWIEPFEKSGFSSTMATEMLNIGMKTDLNEMVTKLAEYMETDIDNTLQKIMKVLPQLVYSIVGVTVILFVLIVFVPVLEAYMGNFLFSAAGL